eukprot:gene12808-15658_t
MVKSLLDSLLGGVKDLTAGQNMGQMASQLSGKARTAWEGQSTLTKGAVAGGLLAMLLSGNARKLVGTGAKIGGAALIGGLAFKAYEDWKSGKTAADTNPDTPLALPQPSDAFLPHDETAADDLSQRLLRAMIAAAKADGQVTPAERARITDTLPVGLGTLTFVSATVASGSTLTSRTVAGSTFNGTATLPVGS